MASQWRDGTFLVILTLIPIASVAQAETSRPDADRPTSPATIRAAEAPIVEVKHEPEEDGWQVAETVNFRLSHRHARSLAEAVLRTAERARVDQMNKWFGAVGPNWTPKCRICLYPSGEAYGEATGAPVNPGGGHTDVRSEDSRVISRCIHVHGPEMFLLKGVVPHEVTHAVLAGRFSDGRVPRWADEGMAILAEAQKNIDIHLRYLPRMRTDNVLFSMRALIEMRDYPEPRELGVFYAQSVSLVDFLSRQKGAEHFAAFVRDGELDGYAYSLRKHYGWSFEELDRHWKRYAFYTKKVVEVAPAPSGKSEPRP
jgi:hypothetical protein